jgi:hypothetical protein
MTSTDKPISPLRQRMIDDMRMRKLSRLCCTNSIEGEFPLTPNRKSDLGRDHSHRRTQLGKPV